MNGQEVLTINLTTPSKEGILHLWGYSAPELPCVRNENYGLRGLYQLESVSWQTRCTAADMQLERRFNKLAKKWKRETINVSSMQQMVSHPCYHEIIAMGSKSKVIPLILKELKREPDFWFSALRALTKEDPVTEDMRGNVMAMRKAWLDWGSKHAYL